MKSIIISIATFFVPFISHAQIGSVQDLIDTLTSLVQTTLIPIAGSIAFFVFFLGIAKFIFSGGNEKNIEEGKRFMFWGVIGLFVLTAVLGIIMVIQIMFFGGPFGWDIPINRNP